MPCYSPLQAYKTKDKVSFKPPSYGCLFGFKVPCGQCIGCRLERSRQWAVRCMHESSLYDENCFLTLTYSDEFLPKDGSLCLRDFQLFMKRLRREYAPKTIRFFHCGEYGDQFARPHYHSLLFNHSFSDRKFFKRSGDGSNLWTSSSLSELWPMGHALGGDVTFESAGYVARYSLKKVTGVRSEEHYQGRQPEYATMSRRPGIGARWYEKFKADVYPRDGVIIRGRTTRPPRFYDSLLGREDSVTLEALKIKRQKDSIHFVTDVLSNGSEYQVSDSSPRRLAVKEEVKLAELQNLVRPLEGL